MPFRIVAISGSPAATSGSARLAEAMLGQLPAGFQAQHLRLATLNAAALVSADTSDPGISDAVEAVRDAHGIILVTPIYKAACSGLMKCFLDLLDQFAFAGKVVLPLATGGSLAHALALDYSLRPILQSMGARHVVQGVLVLSHQMGTTAEGGASIHDDARRMLEPALSHFAMACSADPALSLIGHPDPARLAVAV